MVCLQTHNQNQDHSKVQYLFTTEAQSSNFVVVVAYLPGGLIGKLRKFYFNYLTPIETRTLHGWFDASGTLYVIFGWTRKAFVRPNLKPHFFWALNQHRSPSYTPRKQGWLMSIVFRQVQSIPLELGLGYESVHLVPIRLAGASGQRHGATWKWPVRFLCNNRDRWPYSSLECLTTWLLHVKRASSALW